MAYKKVTKKEMEEIIKSRKPLGHFYRKTSEAVYVGIDNSTGDAWVEEFDSENSLKKWLNGEPVQDVHGYVHND